MEWDKTAAKFVEALASAEPTPGGGAAAAMSGAMGCALVMMAMQTTVNRKSTPENVKAKLVQSLKKMGSLKEELKNFIRKDGEAYAAYLVAKKLPKDTPAREQAVQDALVTAAKVPADTATTAIQCLREADLIKADIAPVILSDVYCGQHLLKACVKCSVESIKANLEFIKNNDWVTKFEQHITLFLKSC